MVNQSAPQVVEDCTGSGGWHGPASPAIVFQWVRGPLSVSGIITLSFSVPESLLDSNRVFPLSLTSPSRVDFECSSTALTAATRQEYRKAFIPLRNCSVERSAARATSVSNAARRASHAARLSASSEARAETARSCVSQRTAFTCWLV